MKISFKIAVMIIAVSLVLISVGNMVLGFFYSHHLIDQENTQVKTNVNSIVSDFNEKELKYESTVGDWGHWDETYDYINTVDPEYVRGNLSEDSFKTLNIDLMVFYNIDNTIVNKIKYDFDKEGFADFPSGLIAKIEQSIKNIEQKEYITRIIDYEGQFYFVSATKITDSLKEKPFNGTFVVGRQIDKSMIAKLEKLTECKITLSTIDSIDSKVAKNLNENNLAYIKTIDEKNGNLNVQVLLPNSGENNERIVLNLTRARDIYKSGMIQLGIVQSTYSLVILIIIIVLFFSINNYVSKPIFNLANTLKDINLTKDRFDRLEARGNSEFSIITNAINNMFSKIEAERDNFKKSENRLKIAQSIAHVGNWELEISSNTIWASIEALNIYGLDPKVEELPFEIVQKSVLGEYREVLSTALEKLITKQGDYEQEFKIKRLYDDKIIYIYSKAELVCDEEGKPQKVVGIIHDITERKKREEEILYNSYHDSLTGLYNRRFMDEEIERMDVPNKLPISVIIGDINGLKLANDVYGHKMGDRIIKKIAKIIKNSCREQDVIARWGGDEFIIFMPNTDYEKATDIANIIGEECSNTTMRSIEISISLGVDTKTEYSQDINAIFTNAENNMYKSKLIETSSIRGKTINTLLNTLYEKNPREEAHSRRVSEICANIGLAMGLTENNVNRLRVMGLVHDIGKIALNEEVLNKNSELTPEEWKEIMRHPEIGYRILSSTNEMSDLAEHILMHHERLDGFGYPKGIDDDEIPLLTRILTVADAYDAMTSTRTYKAVLPQEVAVEELKKNVGTQFDKEVVNVFVEKVLNKV